MVAIDTGSWLFAKHIAPSAASSFKTMLGQFMSYNNALKENGPMTINSKLKSMTARKTNALF